MHNSFGLMHFLSWKTNSNNSLNSLSVRFSNEFRMKPIGTILSSALIAYISFLIVLATTYLHSFNVKSVSYFSFLYFLIVT